MNLKQIFLQIFLLAASCLGVLTLLLVVALGITKLTIGVGVLALTSAGAWLVLRKNPTLPTGVA
jgi:hypothetical protein